MVIWLIAAIMATQMFQGRVAFCNDGTVNTMAQCVGTFVNADGNTVARVWSNPPWGSFDNIGMSLYSLFPCIGVSGWNDKVKGAPRAWRADADALPPLTDVPNDGHCGDRISATARVLARVWAVFCDIHHRGSMVQFQLVHGRVAVDVQETGARAQERWLADDGRAAAVGATAAPDDQHTAQHDVPGAEGESEERGKR